MIDRIRDTSNDKSVLPQKINSCISRQKEAQAGYDFLGGGADRNEGTTYFFVEMKEPNSDTTELASINIPGSMTIPADKEGRARSFKTDRLPGVVANRPYQLLGERSMIWEDAGGL